MKAVLAWLADWRNGLVILASALVAYLGVLVVTSIEDRARALDAATEAVKSEQQLRSAAINRVNSLLGQINLLQDDARTNGAQIARLQAEVAALEAQLRQAGVQPVVVTTGATSSGSGSSSRPSAHPTPRPSSHPTPRPGHTPTPTPSPSRTFCVPLITC